ncbi:hypothetical protein JCM8547_004442 [Rhodosporidiobolus lusitaniae]
MVLQDRHSKLQSKRYKKVHDLETDEDRALKAALAEAEKRRLGSNADRYAEDDEALAIASGQAGPAATAAVEEVDEEEEARKAAELEELEVFRERQREKLLSDPSPSSTGAQDEEEDDDVDHSFAHLRIGGARGKGAGRASVKPEEEDEGWKERQNEAKRMQAVRDLKDRFSGPRPLPSPTPAPSPSSALKKPFSLPPQPGVKPPKTGQDFLDDLL